MIQTLTYWLFGRRAIAPAIASARRSNFGDLQMDIDINRGDVVYFRLNGMDTWFKGIVNGRPKKLEVKIDDNPDYGEWSGFEADYSSINSIRVDSPPAATH
jgi:hypothetical protein